MSRLPKGADPSQMKRNSPFSKFETKDRLLDTSNPSVDTSKGGWVVAGQTAEQVRASNATALLQQYSSTADKASTVKKPDIQPVSDGGFYEQGGQPVSKVEDNRKASFTSDALGSIEGFESRASKGEYGTGIETQNVALETGVTLGDAGVLPANGDGSMSNASNPATNALNSAGKIKPGMTADQGVYNSPFKGEIESEAVAFLNNKKPSARGKKAGGDPDFIPLPSLEPPAVGRRREQEGREPVAKGRPEKTKENRRGGIDFGNARPFGGMI